MSGQNEHFRRCNPEQRRFVIARQTAKSDAAAAKAIGVPASTVYGYPQFVHDAVREFFDARAEIVTEILLDAAVEAAMVKAAGLKSKNEQVKQAAATEIIDRVKGKPSQQINANITADIAVKGYMVISPDDWDSDSTVQAPGLADSALAGQEQDTAPNG